MPINRIKHQIVRNFANKPILNYHPIPRRKMMVKHIAALEKLYKQRAVLDKKIDACEKKLVTEAKACGKPAKKPAGKKAKKPAVKKSATPKPLLKK